uniref:Uncharacterized protein n=1 Tax=Araneus ventricosus TaxID=182803 RepID=A0A4Y2V5M4_ARAVE|nr:hypothetical protein AVEN_196483-1 [Araneus ventricosus]
MSFLPATGNININVTVYSRDRNPRGSLSVEWVYVEGSAIRGNPRQQTTTFTLVPLCACQMNINSASALPEADPLDPGEGGGRPICAEMPRSGMLNMGGARVP